MKNMAEAKMLIIEKLLNKPELKHNPVTIQFNYHSDLIQDKLILYSHSMGI
ncbi:hypothetical protein A6R68_09689, partial [Neotoma lepida]